MIGESSVKQERHHGPQVVTSPQDRLDSCVAAYITGDRGIQAGVETRLRPFSARRTVSVVPETSVGMTSDAGDLWTNLV